MFGQKRTLIENIVTIGPLFFFALMGSILVFIGSLERASLASFFVGIIGLILVLYAKLPLLKQGNFLNFGVKNLSISNKKYYFIGYILISISLIVSIFLLYISQ